MSLKQQILTQWNLLAGQNGADGNLCLELGPGRLECQLTEIDRLACGFTRLALKSDRLASASVPDLKRIGDALASRLTYLLEPICPIELDSEGFTLQLRSNPPQKDDDGTSYYELVARRDGLSLCRFAKGRGQSRTIVPTQVTQEVFVRLVQDFAAVLG